jgi:hypothetical protein
LKPASAPPLSYGHRFQLAESISPLCDEHGIGGSGEHCGDHDAHLGRINVFYHEALVGKYVLRALLFDLEPDVIGAVLLSRRSASSSVRATT